MIQRLFLAIAIIGVIQGINAQSQSGSLKGTITEHDTGEPVPMANVVLYFEGEVVGGSVADFDGNYTIKPINPGRYTLNVSFIGFASKQITDVLVSSNKITFYNAELKIASEVIGEVELVEYVVPLIDPDKSGATKTKEEIMNLPTRNVQSVAAQAAGIYQKDEGSDINIRGSRSDATFFYIDGMKVRASKNLPKSSIEQITVITGGLPASYGDATGGIVSITTRGPSNEFFGGVELNTSEGLDPYGYNLFGFNLSGPLKRNSLGKPVLGFFVSGEYESEKDPDPSAVGVFKLKDDVMKDLQQHPLIFKFDNGIVSSDRAGEFITNEDIVYVDARQNVARQNTSIQGKLDFKPSLKSNITMGGNFSNSKYRLDVYEYSLFNPQNNPEVVENSWRIYSRFQHRFGAQDQSMSNALVKNVYVTLQADYSKDKELTQDTDHGDKLFNYGYIGKFTPIRKDSIVTPEEWANEDNIINVIGIDSLYNISPSDTIFGLHTSDWTGTSRQSNVVLSKNLIENYTYETAGVNPYAERYTKSYFDFIGNRSVSNLEGVTGAGALVNGNRSQNIYSLWFNSGREYNGYSKSDDSQLRFTGSASADVKNHAIQFGFEYEQRDDRKYFVNPIALWELAEQKVNNYIDEFQGAYVYSGLDKLHGTVITKLHSYRYEDMSSFAKKFRSKHGVSRDDVVDIHTYAPDQLDVGMFSADEFSKYADWWGYDSKGNRLNGAQPGMHEFLTEKDDYGDYKREIGAFQPIYMAGYIQDKFTFEDLVCNIGVRFDRYDANQEVLKDPYSIYDVRTAGEVKDFGSHPSNIGDGFVVYVDDNMNANAITGYRNGANWYNAEGLPINDPELLNVSKGVLPMLADPDAILKGDGLNKGLDANAFKDYKPEIIVMPRISFSFPISDEALFYAFYDVLSQRPSANRFNPLDYLSLANKTHSGLIQNPNLKAMKTTNYEVGFKQTLSASSALTINAFYKEMRDMIQYTKVGFAFPMDYITLGNMDFGTTKGLSLAYEMRRTGNLSLNANYTLQFADATGSSSTSGANVVGSSQPNLRTTTPVDYDQRHNIMTNIDFRYGKGSNYTGPLWKGRQIFANTGINVSATAGSGTPYSRQVSATALKSSRSALAGSINGSRLPWTYRVDMRINKGFDIFWGDPEERKSTSVNVYVQVQNLLNTKNIVKVYRYTGNPDDDGYLTSSIGMDDIDKRTDPNSYVDLYSLYLNKPNNYTRPRTVRLGITLDF